MSNPIARVGIIGLGKFGEQHVKVLSQLPNVEVVAVCSRSVERSREIASKYDVPKSYTSTDQMLSDPEFESVDIVTEIGRHTEIALKALESGKHVFSEILLSESLEETDQLIESAKNSKKYFMTGFLERFDIRRAQIKQRIEAGDLGELVSLYGRRNIWRGILDAPRFKSFPLILQPGIHTIDQLLWLSGEDVKEVYARSRNVVETDRADTWWATLTFKSGLIGVIEQSFFVPDSKLYWCDVHLEVVGTEGTAKISEPNDAAWNWTAEATRSPDLFLAPEIHGRVTGALEAELAYFTRCVVENRAPALGTLEDARNSLRVGLAIMQSAETNQIVHL
jgi:predicted dehydrogenase